MVPYLIAFRTVERFFFVESLIIGLALIFLGDVTHGVLQRFQCGGERLSLIGIGTPAVTVIEHVNPVFGAVNFVSLRLVHGRLISLFDIHRIKSYSWLKTLAQAESLNLLKEFIMEPDQILNMKDAAKALGISPQMLAYYIKTGRGPEVIIIAGRSCIERESLTGWKPQPRTLGRPKNTRKGLDGGKERKLGV